MILKLKMKTDLLSQTTPPVVMVPQNDGDCRELEMEFYAGQEPWGILQDVSVGGQVFPEHPIVPAMESDTMVPDLCRNVDRLVQIAILLIVVQLVLIGYVYLHSGSSFLKLVHLFYNYYSTQPQNRKDLFRKVKHQTTFCTQCNYSGRIRYSLSS